MRPRFVKLTKPRCWVFVSLGRAALLWPARPRPWGQPADNLSGGLVSKGHPVGATGRSMVYELVTQLRGEAGPRQCEGADVALAENGDGVIGFDEAACAITLLQRRRA